MPRRFHAGERFTVQGIELRVVQGRKSPDDLRLEMLQDGWWRPLPMALTFLELDFYVDNEGALTMYRNHWKFNGESFFLRVLWKVLAEGWQAAADELAEQRARRARA